MNNNSNDRNVVLKKSTFNKMLSGIIAGALVTAFFGGYVFGINTIEPEKIVIRDAKDILGSSTQSSNKQQMEPQIFQVSMDDDPVKGNADAPLTIIEFSDFQCPFCMKFHSETLPLIEQNYIETGKVKFVYRDFPIESIHPNAVPAALASECADEQGKFWQFHDMLFNNQELWAKQDSIKSSQTFMTFAEKLSMNMDIFGTCLSTAKYSDEINKDLQDGRSYGITGTPGFFVGNDDLGFVKIQGAKDFSVFQQILDNMNS